MNISRRPLIFLIWLRLEVCLVLGAAFESIEKHCIILVIDAIVVLPHGEQIQRCLVDIVVRKRLLRGGDYGVRWLPVPGQDPCALFPENKECTIQNVVHHQGVQKGTG